MKHKEDVSTKACDETGKTKSNIAYWDGAPVWFRAGCLCVAIASVTVWLSTLTQTDFGERFQEETGTEDDLSQKNVAVKRKRN